MWPFKKKEVVAWEQPAPTIQQLIDERKSWVEDGEAKVEIMRKYRDGYNQDTWAKEMVSLEYIIHLHKKEIKKLEKKQQLIFATDGFAHD